MSFLFLTVLLPSVSSAHAVQLATATTNAHLVRRTMDFTSSGHLQLEENKADWSHGESSWRYAMDVDKSDEELWSQPNYCDARVLHGSAPLTVLFGISSFWDEIKKHRDFSSSDRPFEIHIPGAAYPFEGRSDWSLLAKHRPKDVPSVRVVLILGTPWHQDNVPVMTRASEFSEANSFLQVEMEEDHPAVGKVSSTDGSISCKGHSELYKEDDGFKKADLCRDHGNGLEVVCVEKYYQEAAADLAKPDLVVMFSPGFPQIARRSWDQVLRSLLDQQVPIMVNDLLTTDETFLGRGGASLPSPGEDWKVQLSSVEDGMTLTAMQAYDARIVGARRNPFPMIIPRNDDTITAKNAVMQLFSGRIAGAQPWSMPSEETVAQRKSLIEAMDLAAAMKDDDSAAEIKKSLLMTTSEEYNKAMWMFYKSSVQNWLDERRSSKHWKRWKKQLSKEWHSKVEELGLTGKQRQTPWTVEDWIFVLTKLKFGDNFF